MSMARNIVLRVNPAEGRPHDGEIEMCEHKGRGHPDSLMDAACEAASCELSRAYLERCDRILHHNLDKGLLIAGSSEPRFGGGRIVSPMRLIVSGRATPLPDGLSPAAVIRQAVRDHVGRSIGLPLAADQVIAEIGVTSDNLRQAFEHGKAVARANDTSFGVGYAPYSTLEQCVLQVARTLESPRFRAAHPAAGWDFKVMGLRQASEITLTVAVAFVDRHVGGVAEYFEIKHAVQADLARELPRDVRLRLNALDDPGARDESGVYVTVCGLSAEMGDDGQVGRGNRVNGLITPRRPMSLEAAAGKNPVSHVGKLYNVLALLMAREIQQQVEGADEVQVQLLSAIGDPVDEPQVAHVEIESQARLSAAAHRHARDIVERWLSETSRATDMILDGRVGTYWS